MITWIIEAIAKAILAQKIKDWVTTALNTQKIKAWVTAAWDRIKQRKSV